MLLIFLPSLHPLSVRISKPSFFIAACPLNSSLSFCFLKNTLLAHNQKCYKFLVSISKIYFPLFLSYLCRYHHAAVCVPILKTIFVYGGIVQIGRNPDKYQATNEFWKFAIESRKWTKEKVNNLYFYPVDSCKGSTTINSGIY